MTRFPSLETCVDLSVALIAVVRTAKWVKSINSFFYKPLGWVGLFTLPPKVFPRKQHIHMVSTFNMNCGPNTGACTLWDTGKVQHSPACWSRPCMPRKLGCFAAPPKKQDPKAGGFKLDTYGFLGCPYPTISPILLCGGDGSLGPKALQDRQPHNSRLGPWIACRQVCSMRFRRLPRCFFLFWWF